MSIGSTIGYFESILTLVLASCTSCLCY